MQVQALPLLTSGKISSLQMGQCQERETSCERYWTWPSVYITSPKHRVREHLTPNIHQHTHRHANTSHGFHFWFGALNAVPVQSCSSCILCRQTRPYNPLLLISKININNNLHQFLVINQALAPAFSKAPLWRRRTTEKESCLLALMTSSLWWSVCLGL